MADTLPTLREQLHTRFDAALLLSQLAFGELTIEVPTDHLLDVCTALRDEFAFEQLMDVCGVDYSAYGQGEWATTDATGKGFSRGATAVAVGRSALAVEPVGATADRRRRFAAVYHLLSLSENRRLRVRAYAPDDELPVLPSVIDIWAAADWFEREAYDLFGITFKGHPDLRRILCHQDFKGHALRKDYDPGRRHLLKQTYDAFSPEEIERFEKEGIQMAKDPKP